MEEVVGKRVKALGALNIFRGVGVCFAVRGIP